MKVKELKKILEDFPDNADVWLYVEEYGKELVGVTYNLGRTYINLLDYRNNLQQESE